VTGLGGEEINASTEVVLNAVGANWRNLSLSGLPWSIAELGGIDRPHSQSGIKTKKGRGGMGEERRPFGA